MTMARSCTALLWCGLLLVPVSARLSGSTPKLAGFSSRRNAARRSLASASRTPAHEGTIAQARRLQDVAASTCSNVSFVGEEAGDFGLAVYTDTGIVDNSRPIFGNSARTGYLFSLAHQDADGNVILGWYASLEGVDFSLVVADDALHPADITGTWNKAINPEVCSSDDCTEETSIVVTCTADEDATQDPGDEDVAADEATEAPAAEGDTAPNTDVTEAPAEDGGASSGTEAPAEDGGDSGEGTEGTEAPDETGGDGDASESSPSSGEKSGSSTGDELEGASLTEDGECLALEVTGAGAYDGLFELYAGADEGVNQRPEFQNADYASPVNGAPAFLFSNRMTNDCEGTSSAQCTQDWWIISDQVNNSTNYYAADDAHHPQDIEEAWVSVDHGAEAEPTALVDVVITCVGASTLEPTFPPEGGDGSPDIGVVIGTVAGVVVLLMLLGWGGACACKRRTRAARSHAKGHHTEGFAPGGYGELQDEAARAPFSEGGSNKDLHIGGAVELSSVELVPSAPAATAVTPQPTPSPQEAGLAVPGRVGRGHLWERNSCRDGEDINARSSGGGGDGGCGDSSGRSLRPRSAAGALAEQGGRGRRSTSVSTMLRTVHPLTDEREQGLM